MPGDVLAAAADELTYRAAALRAEGRLTRVQHNSLTWACARLAKVPRQAAAAGRPAELD